MRMSLSVFDIPGESLFSCQKKIITCPGATLLSGHYLPLECVLEKCITRPGHFLSEDLEERFRIYANLILGMGFAPELQKVHERSRVHRPVELRVAANGKERPRNFPRHAGFEELFVCPV